MSRKPQKTQNVQKQHIQPKTPKQELLLTALRSDSPLVIATGPAGVGKTYLTVNETVNRFVGSRNRKIILTRPNMPTGRTLGSFPGDIKDKIEPWLSAMIGEFKRRMGENVYDCQYRNGNIQYQPLETIRGASYDNASILVDEAQNLTYEEIKAVSTRIGENSQMVFMGDPMQSDIRDSGLTRLQRIAEKYDLPVPVIHFGVEDIVRSDIVAQLVKAFIEEEKENNKWQGTK